MRTGAAALVLGAVLTGTGSAAQAAPGDRGAELAVRVTVLTDEPRRGSPVEARARISAPDGGAADAMVFLGAASPARIRVSGICAPAVPGYCGLGDVGPAGATVPFTIEVPAGDAPLTLGLGVFAWAEGTWPAVGRTEVTFAPTAPESPPAPSSDPRLPAAPVAAPAPTDPLGLPLATPGAADPAPSEDVPDPSEAPAAVPSAPPSGARTTLVVAEEPGAGQSIRLGVLVASCLLASALALRLGARVRRRTGE